VPTDQKRIDTRGRFALSTRPVSFRRFDVTFYHWIPMSDCYHQHIDARLLRLTESAIRKLDADPALRVRLRENVSRWTAPRLRERWDRLLNLPWPLLRVRLLAKSEAGAALRQDAPLGGILAPTERARIMREFAHDSRAA